jgi:hypothetical protein
MTHVRTSYEHLIKNKDSSNKTNFMICGCDVAIDKSMGCKLMEINKGPDLSYKDSRDKAVKLGLIENTMKQIGLIDGLSLGFSEL